MFQKEIELVSELILRLDASRHRLMIGVAGPPAAGKSTFAELLVEHLNQPGGEPAALVPMDGYHLDNDVLDARNQRSRKGAPYTFDADGFVALVDQISSSRDAVSYATFDRTNDCTVPNSAVVDAGTKTIVVEGNYLLLNTKPWSHLRPLFDLTVFIGPDIEMLEARLVDRWLHYGFDQSTAREKALSNDIPNAKTILENSFPADLSFTGI